MWLMCQEGVCGKQTCMLWLTCVICTMHTTHSSPCRVRERQTDFTLISDVVIQLLLLYSSWLPISLNMDQ